MYLHIFCLFWLSLMAGKLLWPSVIFGTCTSYPYDPVEINAYATAVLCILSSLLSFHPNKGSAIEKIAVAAIIATAIIILTEGRYEQLNAPETAGPFCSSSHPNYEQMHLSRMLGTITFFVSASLRILFEYVEQGRPSASS